VYRNNKKSSVKDFTVPVITYGNATPTTKS